MKEFVLKEKKVFSAIIILLIIISLSFLWLNNITKSLEAQKTYVFSSPKEALVSILRSSGETLANLLWVKFLIYHYQVRHVANTPFEKDPNVMPFMRLISWLNPHFAQAYSIGGYHLYHNLGRIDDGLKFIEEGVKNNPKDASLLWDMAWLNYKYKKNNINAVFYAKKAVLQSNDLFVRMNSYRLLRGIYKDIGDQEKFKETSQIIERLEREILLTKKTEPQHIHKHQHQHKDEDTHKEDKHKEDKHKEDEHKKDEHKEDKHKEEQKGTPETHEGEEHVDDTVLTPENINKAYHYVEWNNQVWRLPGERKVIAVKGIFILAVFLGLAAVGRLTYRKG